MDFTSFYKKYYGQLLQCAKFYLSHEDAEDVVQDVTIQLWEKRDSLTFVENIPSYVFSAVKNKCLDRIKHETYKREYCRRTLSQMKTDMEMQLLSNRSTASDALENNEMEARLNRAISELPPRCRTIYKLRRQDDKHYAEISDMLGISINTIECQMTIAQKRLRKKLLAS